MSDKTFDVSAALTEMDDALVSEAANAGAKRKSRLGWLIPAAAALVVAAGAAIVLPKLLAPRNGDIEASLPEPAEILEATEEPAPAETNGGADVVATFDPAMTTVEPEETAPVIDEPAYAEPKVFDSVVTLSAEVGSGGHSDGSDVLSGLDMIYMPTRVIYGAELEDITVETDCVTVTYGIKKEYVHEEDDPNRCVLIWFRNWQKGSAEEYARSLNVDMGGFFFHEVYGAWAFQSNLETVVVWEENGCGFELIMPAYYCEDGDIMTYKDVTPVPLGEASAHDPLEGLDDGGYLKLKEHEYTYAPLTTFAYGTTYYEPEGVLGGAEGRMIHTDGLGFIESIPEEQKGYDHIMHYFPQVGRKFEPVLSENAAIAEIRIYDPITLEPIKYGLTYDDVMSIAEGGFSAEVENYIFRDCRGCVLVDMVVEHRGDFIEAMGEYELDAYHCGFILDCGN